MAILNLVQAGSFQDVKGAYTTSTITISNIDTSKSILVFQTVPGPGATQRALESYTMGIFSGNNAIVFTRGSAGDAHLVQWYAAEFKSGVTAQHGTQNLANTTTTNITIAAVDTTRSFVLISLMSSNLIADALIDYIRPQAQLTSPTNLQIVTGSNSKCVIGWSVIDYEGCLVTVGTSNFDWGTSSNIISVPMTRTDNCALTFTYFTNSANAASPTRQSPKLVEGFISSNNAITFQRDTQEGVLRTVWQLIEFKDGTNVVNGTANFVANNSGTGNFFLGDSISSSNSVIWMTGHFMSTGKETGVSAGGAQAAHVAGAFVTASSIRLFRLNSSLASQIAYSVIQFNAREPEQSFVSVAN